jgi:predicted metal-dependent peptidase
VKDRWNGLLLQAFQRSYQDVSIVQVKCQEGTPVLLLPKENLNTRLADQQLSLLAENLKGEENLESSEEVLIDSKDFAQVHQFLIAYFGKLDLFDVEIPDQWRILLKEKQEHQWIDWRSSLRLFMQKQGSATRVLSNRKYSKRFNTPPGTKWKPKSRLALVLDISASMEDELIQLFLGEMDQLAAQGWIFTLFQVDDRIRQIEPYRVGMSISIGKGGNTHFDQAIDYIHKSGDYDGIIFCTDAMLQSSPKTIELPQLWVVDKPKVLPVQLPAEPVYLRP